MLKEFGRKNGFLNEKYQEKAWRYVINLRDPFPVYVDEPVEVDIVSAGETPVLLVFGIQIPLIEDVVMDDWWHGKIWTEKVGWNSMKVEGDLSERSFYVPPVGSWAALRLAQRQSANRLASGSAPAQPEVLQKQERIPAIIFFLFFLVASGFIWLAPKL